MSGYMQSEEERAELLAVAQQMTREQLEDAYVTQVVKYWRACGVAEQLYEWAGRDYEEEIRIAKERIEDMERADRALDRFSNFFGRQKKYPEEQE